MLGLKPNLLIVDDEKPTRDGLRRAMEDHFEIYLAQDINSAISILDIEEIDLVLTDLKMGGDQDGMKVLEYCQKMEKPPICIMMTAYGSTAVAVEAMKRGAYHYITKPLNLDELDLLIRRALKLKTTVQENTQLREQVKKEYSLERLIGRSPKMVEIFDTIRQVANSKATVLIQGESGTGKELVAQAIHQLSPRKDKPFVTVHCAALSSNILESEIFGHEKGAFTGAHEKRIGRFEQANGGSIFLDEIGEIDGAIQVKLLRVLGERSFERVGGNKTIETDIRLIAATNKNLEELVRDEKFRDDLFYRINVVRIEMPPLRERKEDVLLLAKGFLKEFVQENKHPEMNLSREVESFFETYDWPGNVRELRTVIEHGVVLCRGKEITLRDLPQSIKSKTSLLRVSKNEIESFNLQEVEKALIIKALDKSEGNRTEAAKLLGISRRTLHRKLNEYQLE
jgi:DNA-binding NtrC family response regulator